MQSQYVINFCLKGSAGRYLPEISEPLSAMTGAHVVGLFQEVGYITRKLYSSGNLY